MPDTQNIIYVATEGVIEFSSAYFANKDEIIETEDGYRRAHCRFCDELPDNL